MQHHAVGKQAVACALVLKTCQYVLRCRIVEIINTGFQCTIVHHYQLWMNEVEIHRRSAYASANITRKAVVRFPVETQRRREIDLVMVSNCLVKRIMGKAHWEIECEVYAFYPVFEFGSGIDRKGICVYYIFSHTR